MHAATIHHDAGTRVLTGVRITGDELRVVAAGATTRVTGAWVYRGDYGWEPEPLVLEVELHEGTAADSGALALDIVKEAQNATQVDVPRGSVAVTGVVDWDLNGLGAAVDLRLVFAVREAPHEPTWDDAADMTSASFDTTTLMNVGDGASAWSTTSTDAGVGIGVAFRLPRPLLLLRLGFHRGFMPLTSGNYLMHLWDLDGGFLVHQLSAGFGDGATRVAYNRNPPPRLLAARRYGLVLCGTEESMTFPTFAPSVSAGSYWLQSPVYNITDDGVYLGPGVRLERGIIREDDKGGLPGPAFPHDPLAVPPFYVGGWFV